MLEMDATAQMHSQKGRIYLIRAFEGIRAAVPELQRRTGLCSLPPYRMEYKPHPRLACNGRYDRFSSEPISKRIG